MYFWNQREFGDIPYVPQSLGRVRRSIWGGYWPGIFLKLSPPEFLCLASLNLKFGAEIPKTVDFFLTANFWWSILAGSKIHAIPTFTTCSLPNIYSLKALPLAAYFYSLCRELRVFCLMWSKSGEMIIFSIVTAGMSCTESDNLQLLPIITIPEICFYHIKPLISK